MGARGQLDDADRRDVAAEWYISRVNGENNRQEDAMSTTTNRADELREQARQHEQDAAESFDRCDTDGFLSQWASGVNAAKARVEADVIEAGGVATFWRLRLETLDGEPVRAKLIDGRYGECWALLREDDSFSGEFVSARPKRVSTMERKGYREVREEFVAEARVKLVGSVTVYPHVCPADPSVDYVGSVGLGDQLTGSEEEGS